MAGGYHSGRFATVNGIAGMRNWQVNDDGTLAPFVNSGTAGGHGRAEGISAWNGGYAGHGALPSVFPGELFSFEGYTAPDNDVKGAQGVKVIGNALVNAASVNWNWSQGGVIDHQVGFDGHLGLTVEDADYPDEDAVISNPEPTTGTKIEYSANGSVWTELENLSAANIQFVEPTVSAVNSSTDGMTARKRGVFDVSATIQLDDSLLGGGLVRGAAYQFRFYTTSTYFYLLKWMRVKGFTGLQANRESAQIIQHQIQLEMAGQIAGVRGQILTPGASPATIWPEA